MRLLLALCLFRCLSGLLVVTHFSPDEYWQAGEVAHRLVFGWGHQTWEWDPEFELRGWAHPLLFVPGLWLLKATGLDSPAAVAAAPRLTQALLTAVGDYAVFRLAQRHFGPGPAAWALALHVSSWFSLYSGTRPFSSAAEAAFTALGLWRWGSLSGLLAAAAACTVRPTAAVTWLAMLPWSRAGPARLAAVGGAALALQLLLDRWGYGHWTLSTWNFLRLNLLEDFASLYGTHPWHWYLSQGLPAVAGASLFLALGVRSRLWAGPAALVAVLSLSPHKEFRFMMPAVPALSAMAGKVAYEAYVRAPRRAAVAAVVVGVANLAVAAYLSRWHQGGVVSILRHLPADPEGVVLHFMTPCHATPLYAAFHANYETRFTDCSPGNRVQEPCGCESDQFRASPEEFAAAAWGLQSSACVQPWGKPPTHVILFSGEVEALRPLLEGPLGLRPQAKEFQSHSFNASDPFAVEEEWVWLFS